MDGVDTHRARTRRSISSILSISSVFSALVFFAINSPRAWAENPDTHPNIVFILADDLGYGDVRCLNPDGKIPTPHLDALAAAGMKFTDAHTSSSVCTPTRYGVLTGRYNWRTRLQKSVLGGMSPPLVDPERLTVASLLKRQGYHTACIGKWHLGMEWPLMEGVAPFTDGAGKGVAAGQVDFARPIRRGPLTAGFDYYFGISASLDMVPYTFIENDRVKVVPTVEKTFPMMAGRTGYPTTKGLAAEGFEPIDVLPALTRAAVDYIGQRTGAAAKSEPFFLYLPLNAPHSPIFPTPEWQGKSGLNVYGDFVMEVDDAVGKVLAALERTGVAGNTLVFFASDNGCAPVARIDELNAKGHLPNGPLRGMKSDIFDGGHRVPFIARWPGRIPAGSTSSEVVCLNDFMATCAQITGVELPPNAAEDSVSLLAVLRGEKVSPLHKALVHHSASGFFAVRQGKWKLNLCAGSGGWSNPRPGSPEERGLAPDQLYDLSADLGEQHNLAAEHPEIVTRLTKILERYIADGRSTPGPKQANDAPIEIRKVATGAPPKVPDDLPR
jgi:arylsulfatase A